jgi:hypothetical protein
MQEFIHRLHIFILFTFKKHTARTTSFECRIYMRGLTVYTLNQLLKHTHFV